jgi:predicted nucleic acid-binding protein
MSQDASRFVVDASVVIKLFIEEPLSDHASALFNHPTRVYYAPGLVYAECANILWKYTKRFGMSEREATRNLGELRSLTLRTIPTNDCLQAALRLAMKHNISVYDACYVATAVSVGGPLVTADEKLIAKVSDPKIRLFSLESMWRNRSWRSTKPPV